MRAMLFRRPGTGLDLAEIADPQPGPGQVLIRIHTCGVCRTDLNIVDGELPRPKHSLVPRHEILGHVVAMGAEVAAPSVTFRVEP
jgi:propanol-preferring alcohol dehydrogenase